MTGTRRVRTMAVLGLALSTAVLVKADDLGAFVVLPGMTWCAWLLAGEDSP